MTAVQQPEQHTRLVTAETERQVIDFLLLEAQLLHGLRFDDWLDILAPDITYQDPVRATRPPRQGSDFSDVMFHFNYDLQSLPTRFDRLNTGLPQADVPPPRTPHFATN